MPTPFLASRSAVLRRRPLVVGTLTGRADLRDQLRRAASPFIDLVEVRLDTFRRVHGSRAPAFALDLLQSVRRATRKPLLLTLRHHGERGHAAPASERMDDAARERLMAPLLPLAALVDVEVRRPVFARRMSSLARRLGVGVIHSYHDFRGARLGTLDGWASRARRLGADVFKAAVTPRQDGELEAFLKWGLDLRMPRVLIGMGAPSVVSRTVGYTFGSILTYGHLGRTAAPGQTAAPELGRAVRQIYGGGRA